jgi:hypothetical protein
LYAEKKDHWKDFAQDARRMGSPLYAVLAEAIDGDDALKALTEGSREGQPRANLLLSAVHFLLLRGARHLLREYYPTLGGTRTGAEVFPLFRDFALGHGEAVRRLVETRVTNTNEVGRSAVLRAGFGALAEEESRPLYLIEIGPSAGLNMIWDRYGVRYRKDGAAVAEVLPHAKLVLSCDLKSGRVPPVNIMPHIAGRVGLELNPVNLADQDDRDWLRALVWPDQPQRLSRLQTAIGMFLERPAEVRGGDALALLPAALAQVPPGAGICVYHTIALYQFSPQMRQALRDLLVTAGLSRPVWHLSFEFAGGSDYAVNLTHHQDGVVRARTLGLAQPHGAWIDWGGA